LLLLNLFVDVIYTHTKLKHRKAQGGKDDISLGY